MYFTSMTVKWEVTYFSVPHTAKRLKAVVLLEGVTV